MTFPAFDEGQDAAGPLKVSHVLNPPASTHEVRWDHTTITFTPSPNFHGDVLVEYRVSNGNGSTRVTAKITVTPVNDAPSAASGSSTVHRQGPLALAGVDVDGDPLTYEIVEGPLHGIIAGTAAAPEYVMTENFTGDEVLTYRVSDGRASSAVATWRLVVSPGSAPLATPRNLTLVEDSSGTAALHGVDLDNDPLSFAIVTPPAHGTLGGTAPNLSYTPAADYSGSDSFTYTASDGLQTSAPVRFTIQVMGVNDVPVATPQSVETVEDTALPVTLSGTDVEASPLSFTLLTQPAHGTITGLGSSRTYTPHANYHGLDSFTFVASDAQATSAPATVTVQVGSVPDLPVAASFSATLAEDSAAAVTLQGSDGDGDAVVTSVVSAPSHGTLSGAAPLLTYTPAPDYHGTDTFTYTASAGGDTSATATVTLQVSARNDAPIASDGSATTAEDTAVALALVGSDIDDATLTYQILEPPADGVVTGSGASRTYTPAANAHGTRTFTFAVSDGGASDTGTFTIDITPVNDAPTAVADFAATEAGAAISIEALANDTDVEGDALTLDAVADPAHGSAALEDGAIVYTPDAGFTGVEELTYSVRDVHGAASTGQVHVGVGELPPGMPAQTIATAGAIAGYGTAVAPSISSDGRVIAFVTLLALTSDDTNSNFDVYVYDRVTAELRCASGAAGGVAGDGGATSAHLSASGRYVVFSSSSTNLVAGDSNGAIDVFRRDRVTGETVRLSVASNGLQGNSESSSPRVSDDGNLVAFASTAFNLIADDANGVADIFVRDVAAGTTARVSVSATGGEGDLAASQPALSGDGRYVAFASSATNLVPGDSNARADVFLRDRLESTTTRVSVSSTGGEGNQHSSLTAISRTGRFISFLSAGSNLVLPSNPTSMPFVRDRLSATTTRTEKTGVNATLLSADGRYLVGHSSSEAFVRDRFAALTSVLAPRAGSTWQWLAISANGRYVVALDRVTGDVRVTPNPL